MNPGIEISGLTLWRDGKLLISNASFRVNRGEIVALIGPSGCGKSSLLSVITGLLKSDAGSIKVTGEPVGPGNIPINRCVLLPQFSEHLVLPWRSVRGHLRLAGLAEAEFAQYIGKVDLTGNLLKKPGQLSGGMMRRLALASVVGARSPVILLDEPFTGLDLDVTLRCWDFLEEQVNTSQAAVLFITHSLEEAAVLADRVLLFEQQPPGRLTSLSRNQQEFIGIEAREAPPSERYRNMSTNGCDGFADYLRGLAAKI
jgi:NitT/TauT family transport system ATP-binding protein